MTTDYMQRYALAQQQGQAATGRNLAVLFDKLAELKIEEVTVTFDGSGDSGQIEDVAVHPATDLEAVTMPVESIDYANGDLTTTDQPLSEAVESICYSLLDQDNDGWENNDGACGAFLFSVAERTVELDFNARFTDSVNSTYTYAPSASVAPLCDEPALAPDDFGPRNDQADVGNKPGV